MSAQPDPTVSGTRAAVSPPPGGQNSFQAHGDGTLVDQHPELLAAGGFAGGLALAMILKRLGS